MSDASTSTPAEAFRALQTKVKRTDSSRATTLFGKGGHGDDHILYATVPDQMVVLPNRRVVTHSRLRVATLSDCELVIQLSVTWKSVFGQHKSVSAYKVTLDGDDITIEPMWQQSVPTPTLEHIEIHAGHVTAPDYHQRILDELRSSSSDTLVWRMLFDSDTERTIHTAEFLQLVDHIIFLPVEL